MCTLQGSRIQEKRLDGCMFSGLLSIKRLNTILIVLSINVADMAVTIGMIAIILTAFFDKSPQTTFDDATQENA